jgi:hypothetical protein
MYKWGCAALVLRLNICNLVQVKVEQDKWRELLPSSFSVNHLEQITIFCCWTNMESEDFSPV